MNDNLSTVILACFIGVVVVYDVYNETRSSIIRDCNPTAKVAAVMEDKSLSEVIKWHRTCRQGE